MDVHMRVHLRLESQIASMCSCKTYRECCTHLLDCDVAPFSTDRWESELIAYCSDDPDRSKLTWYIIFSSTHFISTDSCFYRNCPSEYLQFLLFHPFDLDRNSFLQTFVCNQKRHRASFFPLSRLSIKVINLCARTDHEKKPLCFLSMTWRCLSSSILVCL